MSQTTTEQILSGDDFSDRLRALRAEALQAGDREQAALCDRALAGAEDAQQACAEVMAEREARAIN